MHVSETAGALLLLACACAAAAAQDSTPAVGAEVVRLDVVVTDARGKPVGDLTRDDFAVFEDGKPQQLTSIVFLGGVRAGRMPRRPRLRASRPRRRSASRAAAGTSRSSSTSRTSPSGLSGP